ncbi:MAG: copper chaperone PCu(A)C [Acidimicrobiales bacterium]
MTPAPPPVASPRRRAVARPFAASLALWVLGATALAGCGSSDGGAAASTRAAGGDGISVEHLTIDAPANPTTSVLRMEVRNGASTADALVAVATPVATGASIHRTEIDAEGRSSMAPEPRVPIPARSTVTFAPDGLHVMVTGVHERLEVGDEVPVELTFRSGTVHATAEVVPPGSTQEGHDGH